MAENDQPLLVAESLCKNFGRLAACSDISFTLHPGEVLAIVGESGSGKSTLLQMLSAQMVPSSGRVPRRGELCAGWNRSEQRGAGRERGAVFRSFDGGIALTQDFTDSAEAMQASLSSMHSGDGGAAILDALQYSVRLLEGAPRNRRRVLLLISETRDHGSYLAKIQDVVSEIGNSNVVVSALPFSPSRSQVLDTERGYLMNETRSTGDLFAPLMMASQAVRRNTPKAITEMTGGEYEMFASRKSFERLMTTFANHLQSRYLLSFQPEDPHPGLHQIRVRLRQPGKATVLARTSYWAEGESQRRR